MYTPFHWMALRLRAWRSWRFLKKFEIAAEALSLAFAKIWDVCASSTLLDWVSFWYDHASIVTMMLRCSSASATLDGLQGCFYYAAITAKDLRLRFISVYDDAFAVVLRPQWWSCADARFTTLWPKFWTAIKRRQVEWDLGFGSVLLFAHSWTKPNFLQASM